MHVGAEENKNAVMGFRFHVRLFLLRAIHWTALDATHSFKSIHSDNETVSPHVSNVQNPVLTSIEISARVCRKDYV